MHKDTKIRIERNKMIIVKLMGRLGNQMFQYALVKRLQSMEKDVIIDSTMLKYDNNRNELGVFPNVCKEFREADKKYVDKLGDCNKAVFYKIKRKVFGYKKTHVREQEYLYHPEILELDNVYLDGYWQTEKYFSSIKNEIHQLYTFPAIEDTENTQMAGLIQNCNSISLHIRRGDYLSAKNAPMHGNICTKAYYNNAIDYMNEHVDAPYFFIFTDDPEWARIEYGNRTNYTIVDINHDGNSYRDMQLMSLCRHNIVANSSFSWWGAWLNKNKDKIVVMPPKWFNLAKTPDIKCEGWTVVENRERSD